MVGVDPYQGDAVVFALYDVLNPDQQIGHVMVGILWVPPDLEAAYGEQFCLTVAWEFHPLALGADVKVTPQGGHILPPPVHLFSKESIFGHDVVDVKDEGI